MQAYCFKCRKKVEVKNAERVILKNGRPAVRGGVPADPGGAGEAGARAGGGGWEVGRRVSWLVLVFVRG